MTASGKTGGSEDWNDIVVGAGAAGSVVAARLSENGSRRVLVLEAGPPDTLLLKPFGLGYYMDMSSYEWGYWSQPDPSRNMRTDHWRRGRVVGGTGSINGMNYVRGAASDYDRWAAMGNAGWSADDIMPLFQELEHCEPGYKVGPDPLIRGMSGPLPIREVGHCHSSTEAFLRSTEAAGYPRNDDYNGAGQEGIGYGQFNQRRGFRRTSADVFLKPALRRRNLELFTNAHVHRLRVSDGRITGVVYERDRTIREARADRVVLCGGAINTPQTLLLSGIGDGATLAPLGIDVLFDRPQVGRNLIEHPIIRTAFRIDRPSYNPTEGLLQNVRFLAKFILTGDGPVGTLVEAQAFLRTSDREPEPDLQILYSPFGAVFSNEAAFYKSVEILPYPSVSIHLVKSHPMSRGRIRLASPDPSKAPLIEPNLLGDPRDVETLVRGIRLLRRIITTYPMADMVIEEVEPRPELASDDALAEFVRARAGLAYHPAGTCRMGVDEDAVVSPDLRVRGLENLWIADASVIPAPISGNIYAACVIIGDKLGRQLRGG